MMMMSRLLVVLVAVVALGGGGVSAQPTEMHGSGTTNPSKFFWKVMDLMEERARTPISMTYRAVGEASCCSLSLSPPSSDAHSKSRFLIPP